MNTGILSRPNYWNDKYINNNTCWVMKSSNPVFVDLLAENKLIKSCKLLIPGSGKGYDAIAATEKNYEVTAVDLSEKVTEIFNF